MHIRRSKLIYLIILATIIAGAYLFICSGNVNEYQNSTSDITLEACTNTKEYYAAIDACPLPEGGIFVLYAKPPSSENFADKLIRFDSDGKLMEKMAIPLAFAHTINPSGKGTYLITDHGTNRLLEIDVKGNLLLEISDEKIGIPGFNFNSAIITPKDTILASARDWGIVEIDKEGKVLWKYLVVKPDDQDFQDSGSHDATLLENGNIMYVSTKTNEIIEINRKGEKIKTISHKTIKLPKNARRMKNGNTIIAHSGGLTELDKNGKIVNWADEFKSCYNFKVVDDGSIILAHSIKGAVFLSPKFKKIKTIEYNAPKSWDTLKANLPKEIVDQLLSLGYLR